MSDGKLYLIKQIIGKLFGLDGEDVLGPNRVKETDQNLAFSFSLSLPSPDW